MEDFSQVFANYPAEEPYSAEIGNSAAGLIELLLLLLLRVKK